MNTIKPMYANNTALKSIRANGYGAADFDIDRVPLKYQANAELYFGFVRSSKYAIYRTDTGAELGIHGEGYKPVAPKTMIDTTRDIIERSGLSINNMTETISTSHNGSRTFVKYGLPEHTYKTIDGDSASLNLLALSSFDGTWPFLISAAAIQSACTNLQVFVGGEVAVYKAKHTEALDIELGGRVIQKSLEVFHNQRDLWTQWHNTSCSLEEAFRFFATALKCNTTILSLQQLPFIPDQIIASMPRRNASLEYIWNAYRTLYSKRLGHNYWSVFNAMTDWSTHAGALREASKINMASIQNTRQQLVQDAVKNNKQMMAA